KAEYDEDQKKGQKAQKCQPIKAKTKQQTDCARAPYAGAGCGAVYFLLFIDLNYGTGSQKTNADENALDDAKEIKAKNSFRLSKNCVKLKSHHRKKAGCHSNNHKNTKVYRF